MAFKKIMLLCTIATEIFSASQLLTDGFVTEYLPPSLNSVPDRPGQRLFEVYLPMGMTRQVQQDTPWSIF